MLYGGTLEERPPTFGVVKPTLPQRLKPPVSPSLFAVVPHMIIPSPRLQPGKIVFSDANGLLPHYRHLVE
jgi:hypothetical protein